MSHDTLDLFRPASALDVELTHDLLEDLRLRHDLDLLAGTLVMRLTCRKPYQDGAGGIDVYKPGRWDTSSDMVYMTAIVDGPSPGQWEGSAGYGSFTAPNPGGYVVAMTFTANGSTAFLNGPWGSASQGVPSGPSPVAGSVSALWTAAAAGEAMSFQFSFRGGIIGYLNAIEVHAL